MYATEKQKKGWIEMVEVDKSALPELEQEKIKVTEANVIVRRTNIGFYFEIKYREVGKQYYNVGFGSYNIHIVFNCLDESFEFAKD